MRRLSELPLFPVLVFGLAVLVLATAASADEIRLKDGTVLIGKATVRGDAVQVVTADGAHTIALDDVVRIRRDAELREELARLAEGAADAPHVQLGLARQARRWGLVDDMWDHLDAAVEHRSPNGGLSRRIDDFLAGLEDAILPRHRLRTDPQSRVKELLYRVRSGQSKAKLAAIEVILARLTDEQALSMLRHRARYSSSERQRLVALRAIQRRDDPQSRTFLYRTAILDRGRGVRAESMAMAREDGRSTEAVRYLAPGLVHRSPHVRIRTAEAFEALGDVNAAPILVSAGPLAATAALPGGSVRGHVAFLTQQSYVRDFDVEVAQAAFIADPKIDVVQSGVVLDATVHAVVTMRRQIVDSYRSALRTLVGADPGPVTRRWEEWYASLPQVPKLDGRAVGHADAPRTEGRGVASRKPAAGPAGPANPGPAVGTPPNCPTDVPNGTLVPGIVVPQPARAKTRPVPTPPPPSPSGRPGPAPASRPTPATGTPAIVRPGGFGGYGRR